MPVKSKFTIVMTLYGIDWPGGGGTAHPGTPLEWINVRALISKYHAQPVIDPIADDPHFSYVDSAGVTHDVWYSNRRTIADRVALARKLGLGVGVLAARTRGSRHLGHPGRRLSAQPLALLRDQPIATAMSEHGGGERDDGHGRHGPERERAELLGHEHRAEGRQRQPGAERAGPESVRREHRRPGLRPMRVLDAIGRVCRRHGCAAFASAARIARSRSRSRRA